MKLDEIASRRVFILNPAEPVARALVLMQEEGIHHLPVVRGRTPLGIVSDHDVLENIGWTRASERRALAPSTRVEKIMRSPMVSLSPDDPIESAALLMLKKHIGAVPLEANGRLVGIVTETDFLPFLAGPNAVINDDLRELPCDKFMPANLFCVGPNDATLDAYRLMRTQQLRHLPVVENERLIGVLSDRDILRGSSSADDSNVRFSSHSPVASPLFVRGIMSREVETLEPTAPISRAAELMLQHKIRSLPLVEPAHDRLVGIITETDLLRAFVESVCVRVLPN